MERFKFTLGGIEFDGRWLDAELVSVSSDSGDKWPPDQDMCAELGEGYTFFAASTDPSDGRPCRMYRHR